MSDMNPDKMSQRGLRLEVKGNRAQQDLDTMRVRIMIDQIDDLIGDILKEMIWGPAIVKVGDDEYIGTNMEDITI